MKQLTSGTGILALRKEMDRLFDRLWDRDWTDVAQLAEGWLPPLDVIETDQNVIVSVEVPGMEAKDVHVTVRENLLILRGEKRTEGERKDEKTYRMERSFGSFTRHVALPVAVDASKVNATVHAGVLKVTLPKTPAAKGMEVPVLAS
jgi:HSP20 family protein